MSVRRDQSCLFCGRRMCLQPIVSRIIVHCTVTIIVYVSILSPRTVSPMLYDVNFACNTTKFYWHSHKKRNFAKQAFCRGSFLISLSLRQKLTDFFSWCFVGIILWLSKTFVKRVLLSISSTAVYGSYSSTSYPQGKTALLSPPHLGSFWVITVL